MLHDLNSDLLTAEKTLSHWEQNYPNIIRSEASAKVAYELAWADAVEQITATYAAKELKAPTVAVLEAEATQKCANEIKAKRMAEAEAEIAKKLIGIAETTLTSIQTRVKLETMEMSLSK